MKCKYCKAKIDLFERFVYGMCYWCHRAKEEVEEELQKIERSKDRVIVMHLINDRRKYFEVK